MGVPFLLGLPMALALPTESEVFAGVLHHIDQNGDGGISAAEYARVDDATPFSSLDHDGDGNVDVAELTAFVKLTQPRPMDRPVLRPDGRPSAPVRTPPASASAAETLPAGTSPLRWALGVLGIAIVTIFVLAVRAHLAVRRPLNRRRWR